MNVLILDVESTIYKYPGEIKSSKRIGSPYNVNNKLVMVGLKWTDSTALILNPNVHAVIKQQIQNEINSADVVVGHNIKFDLHWLSVIGININNIKQVWDTQIAEFLWESQRNPYNSLNDACDKYGIPRKLDVIELEYWDKCIDTDEIPTDILREYLETDLDRTERVFKEQAKQFRVVL